VDTYLAIASKRDGRRYADRPIPPDVVDRILDGGRLSGSSQNKQRWRFLIVERRELVEQLAECVYAPQNVLTAGLVVAVSAERGFDLGRCAQNMMLAAWNDGVVSCPNGVRDGERARELLGLEPDAALGIVLTFAFPARGRDPETRPAEEWSRRANRKPLAELVERL
jgi:nitroreductase